MGQMCRINFVVCESLLHVTAELTMPLAVVRNESRGELFPRHHLKTNPQMSSNGMCLQMCTRSGLSTLILSTSLIYMHCDICTRFGQDSKQYLDHPH